MSGWLDEWLELEPERSLAHLVAGQHAIASAWAVRTPYEAKHVSAERFAGFFDLLEVARSSLSEAARLDPDDGGPWAFMLSIAMGLEYERERIHEMYERVQSLDPWHPAAHGTMVQVLGAKWGGSTSAMLDFAHEVSNEAPEGELVHFVVPGAHFEASEFKGGEGYFRDPGVRRAIFDAAARSVDSSRLTASPWTVRVRNVFAVAYYQMGETDRLRRELEIIGPTITQPWTAFGNPVGEFKRARKMAGLR